jgi:hypothetical protein
MAQPGGPAPYRAAVVFQRRLKASNAAAAVGSNGQAIPEKDPRKRVFGHTVLRGRA